MNLDSYLHHISRGNQVNIFLLLLHHIYALPSKNLETEISPTSLMYGNELFFPSHYDYIYAREPEKKDHRKTRRWLTPSIVRHPAYLFVRARVAGYARFIIARPVRGEKEREMQSSGVYNRRCLLLLLRRRIIGRGDTLRRKYGIFTSRRESILHVYIGIYTHHT